LRESIYNGNRFVLIAVRAPHPAATGGGFGFAPWENPGPRPPKAGAALSPTGQGKFRRDEQGCPKFVAAPHGSFLVARIRHLTSVLSPVAAERMHKLKRPDRFIGRRFRFIIQNVICLIHNFSNS
jgi:hypothetical protein